MGRASNNPPPPDFRKFLADTLVKRREIFLEQHALVLAKAESDPVHDLRVSIRRLAAVFSLIENIARLESAFEAADDLDSMMKPLGELRDVQVRIEWIEKLIGKKKAPILVELKAQEMEMMAAIGSAIIKIPLGRILADASEKSLRPLDDFLAHSGRDLESLCREEMWNLMARFAKRASRFNRTDDIADMHSARIALKKFRYTFEIFRPYYPKLDASEISDLQTRLGDIHDLDLLIDWIESIIDARPADEKIVFIDLLSEARGDRARRLVKLKKSLEADIELAHKWRSKMRKKGKNEKRDPEAARPRVLELASKYDPEPEHAGWVAEQALLLFDELKKHGLIALSDSHRTLLEYATLLHDTGWVDGQSGHHKRSFDIIVNSSLPLDEKDTLIIGLVARFHRKAEPGEQKDFMKLAKKDRDAVSKLAAIIRVADVLDRAHDQRARITSTALEQDAFVVNVTPKSISGLPAEAIQKKTALFATVFGIKVDLSDGTPTKNNEDAAAQ